MPSLRLIRAALILCLLVCAGSGLASAQATKPQPGDVATDPIRCWWRADRGAIRIGERFSVVLTCAVIETGPITVVPDVTQLDPGAVSLTPFDVEGGQRHEDVVASPWRYMQFEYTMRLLGDGFFGSDVSVPPLMVKYNIRDTRGGEQGRDKNYVLPVMPMRVLSLVPRAARDIRDDSADTFASVEDGRFRSTASLAAALTLFGLAGVLVVVGTVRAFGGMRSRKAAVVRVVPPYTLLGRCASDLQDVRTDAARDGWSPALARQALTRLRLAGAVATGRPIATMPATVKDTVHEGQLLVRHGLLRPRRALVSAATTSPGIIKHAGNSSNGSAAVRASFEPLQEALRAFSVAAYARNGNIDGSALDSALDGATSAIAQVRSAHRWPMRILTQRSQ